MLGAVTFIPVVISIVRLSQIKGWVWPSALLALGNVVFVVMGNTFRNPTMTGRWAFLAASFGLTAAGLFSYLRNSRSGAQAELYTAVNLYYLLLGLPWAAINLALDAFSPGSIRMGTDPADRQTELLYFQSHTPSTIGYGDIVPLSGEARILAALEGGTGVLYIATTVALLVGRFKSEWE